MDTKNSKPTGEKVRSLIGFINNAKFLFFTIATLAVLGLALASGDGKKIVLNFYENVSGQKFETFSPVQDRTSHTFLMMADKLFRDTGVKVENTDVTIFEASDVLHKYQIKVADKIYHYKVEQMQSGVWRIDEYN